MIKINHLIKYYNEFELNIKQIKIIEGDHIALIGNNGSGKSTLLKLILDLIKRDNGQVYINNKDVSYNSDWKKFVNSYLDEDFLIDFLTPNEYIDFITKFHKKEVDLNEDYKYNLLKFFNFYENDKLIRTLSKGNKLKIGIISAIITFPKLLILDEPFSNLDPSSKLQLINILNTLYKYYRVTTIISSHDINEVLDISNKLILLENGVVLKNEYITENTIYYLKDYFNSFV